MEWYEYIIMIIAIGLVVLPIILSYVNKKRGKQSCDCGCNNCTMKNDCLKNFKAYVNEAKNKGL